MSRNIIIKALLCLSVVSIIAAYTDNAVADQIVNLPGAENLDIDFNQFSGYLQIPGNDPNINKNMHYWFVESKSDPANDPIAVWTNGGVSFLFNIYDFSLLYNYSNHIHAH